MPQEKREPLAVRVAMLVLLLNIFLWIGFRSTDLLIVSLCSAVLALIGWITAQSGKRKARHLASRGGSDTLLLLAYWGNLILFLLALLLFAYLVAMGILRGELV
jgi:hypothetical protein